MVQELLRRLSPASTARHRADGAGAALAPSIPGARGLCGMPLKKWVDAQIVLPKPKFDQDMADEDAEIDAANVGQDSSPTVFAPPVVKVQNQTAADATDVP